MGADVAVVIVAHNSASVLPGLLESLPAALGELTALTVVVDNGSSDETVDAVESLGGCKVVRSENLGYAAGINIGVDALPDAESILILNPDVRLAPGSVETMFTTMKTTNAGVVAPRVLEPDGRLFRSMRREPTLLRASGLSFTHWPVVDEYVSDPDAYDHRQVVDWALGAALLIRTDCHTQLSGWDETFFLYSEETDFSLRAADAGWQTLYEPRAVVTHIGGQSGRSPRTHTMQIINRVRLYARRHGRLAGWAYFALTLASETSWLVRGNRDARSSITALLSPRKRPAELGCSNSLLPT